MYARVTTVQSPPDGLDDATRHIRENLLPQLQQQDGFKGFIGLGDRQSGKMLGVVLWESEEALRASDEAASRLRSGAAEATGSTVADVDRYEVTLLRCRASEGEPGPLEGRGQALRPFLCPLFIRMPGVCALGSLSTSTGAFECCLVANLPLAAFGG